VISQIDRKGPHAELRYRLTRWIEVGGSSVKLRTSAAESNQYNGNTSFSLPGNFQLSLARSESRLKVENWGSRVTLNVQTDLGRDIRNETLFALSNLRTSSASLTVKLSRSANLRFEYYGTRVNYELNRDSILTSALLGNSVEPVLGGANRNVFFVQYQKTLRWGKSASAEYDKTTTGVAIVRPVGTVGGRVFIDEMKTEYGTKASPAQRTRSSA